MFPNLLKMVQVKCLKLLRIRLWGFIFRVTGSTANQTQRSAGPATAEWGTASGEPEPFIPIELEQAFNGAYRSYRVNGRPKMDVDMFFNRIKKGLIELIKRELKT